MSMYSQFGNELRLSEAARSRIAGALEAKLRASERTYVRISMPARIASACAAFGVFCVGAVTGGLIVSNAPYDPPVKPSNSNESGNFSVEAVQPSYRMWYDISDGVYDKNDFEFDVSIGLFEDGVRNAFAFHLDMIDGRAEQILEYGIGLKAKVGEVFAWDSYVPESGSRYVAESVFEMFANSIDELLDICSFNEVIENGEAVEREYAMTTTVKIPEKFFYFGIGSIELIPYVTVKYIDEEGETSKTNPDGYPLFFWSTRMVLNSKIRRLTNYGPISDEQTEYYLNYCVTDSVKEMFGEDLYNNLDKVASYDRSYEYIFDCKIIGDQVEVSTNRPISYFASDDPRVENNWAHVVGTTTILFGDMYYDVASPFNGRGKVAEWNGDEKFNPFTKYCSDAYLLYSFNEIYDNSYSKPIERAK